MNADEYKTAINYLFTVLNVDDIVVPSHPQPLDDDLDDIVTKESPVEIIQQNINCLMNSTEKSKSASKVTSDVFTVYIPGFVNKNLAETEFESDDPLMNSIENTDYPHAPPFVQERTPEFIKE